MKPEKLVPVLLSLFAVLPGRLWSQEGPTVSPATFGDLKVYNIGPAKIITREEFDEEIDGPGEMHEKKKGQEPVMSRLLFYFQQACKPGSVSRLSRMGRIPGSLSFICSTYPPASGEQPLSAGIHGLSAQKAGAIRGRPRTR